MTTMESTAAASATKRASNLPAADTDARMAGA